jgi:heme exporter protein D
LHPTGLEIPTFYIQLYNDIDTILKAGGGTIMDWLTFGTSLLGAGFVGAMIQILLGHKLRIRETELAEQRQREQRHREASAAVAEVLGEWIRSTYTGTFSNEDRWRLQTVYWKNIMLLDKELVDLIIDRLANVGDAVGTNELIVQARKVLFGLEQPDISAAKLNNWLPEA